ncbi:MAG: GNAT family N-acetyltransferase [Chloroflexi bacterium]|nr:GNAT family N-acetyltransferase [Chloroflexota bacterium]
MAPYLLAIGPGEHLLGSHAGLLVSHLMWVTRWLQPAGMQPLRTAYVELVATAPEHQRQGYATRLLEAFPSLVQDYDVAALAPTTERLYARLGWRFWQGPLAVRREGKLMPTPAERVMFLHLPRTPALDDMRTLSVEWRPGELW